jgi:hypothetical protein
MMLRFSPSAWNRPESRKRDNPEEIHDESIDIWVSGMYLHCNYIALAFYERGFCPKWTLIGTIRHLNGMVL